MQYLIWRTFNAHLIVQIWDESKDVRRGGSRPRTRRRGSRRPVLQGVIATQDDVSLDGDGGVVAQGVGDGDGGALGRVPRLRARPAAAAVGLLLLLLLLLLLRFSSEYLDRDGFGGRQEGVHGFVVAGL